MRRQHRTILWVVIAAVVLLFAITGFYRVPEGSQAVLMTFGKMVDLKTPGMYWRIPMAQSVQIQSITNIYTVEYGFRTQQTGTATSGAQYVNVLEEAIMLTGDGNIVQVEAVYQVVVQDLPAYFFKVENPFASMQYAFETILRRNVQNRSLDDALLNKQDIEMQVLPDFQQLIDSYGLGIKVREVRIQNIIVPDDVAPAYEDVNNAMNEKNRKLDEAERYKNEVVPAARAVAYRMIQDAEAYKAEQTARAQGDVALFNEVYAKYAADPEITRKRLLIETMEAILRNADAKIILEESDGSLLKILSLDPDAPTATVAPTAAPQGGE